MTTEVKVTVPAKYICVLKLFCAQKHDVRTHLRGVCLEILGTEARLVATDGYRLGVFRVRNAGLPVATEMLTAAIPSDLLADIKPKGSVIITLGEQDKVSIERPITIEYPGGGIVTGRTIGGSYPNYRRLIPRELSGDAAQFNAEYIADLAKAARILHESKNISMCLPTIGYNGKDAALIDLGNEDFVGVIMPLCDNAPKRLHAWVYEMNCTELCVHY
ncbi:MAG: hypothetical protein L0Z53_14185 [Acidobacteriales bacterium]|nr:hypothetical protein [Terriglobales bacterium]